jgi:hypothetical protein
MILFDYKNAIHPDSGKTYEVHKDIIITPFWTEEFCKQLVEISKFYSTNFKNTIKWGGSEEIGAWKDLALNHISDVTFLNYCRHYKRDIIPIMSEVFGKGVQTFGWFTPNILRYDNPGDCISSHYDVSWITLNIKLNNDYQGCDLVFPRQGFDAAKVPLGYAMVWPSLTTHPHHSTPLISGTKYAFSSWTWPPFWSPGDAGSIVNSDQL